MQVRIAILLVLLSLPCPPAVAAVVAREVPDQFLGDWCTQSLPDEEDAGESDIRISEHEISYYRDGGKILAAAAIGDQLTLIVQLQEDGRIWLDTHEFELSEDGKRLTTLRDDGKIRIRIRCQRSPTPPPDNGLKPTLRRGPA